MTNGAFQVCRSLVGATGVVSYGVHTTHQIAARSSPHTLHLLHRYNPQIIDYPISTAAYSECYDGSAILLLARAVIFEIVVWLLFRAGL